MTTTPTTDAVLPNEWSTTLNVDNLTGEAIPLYQTYPGQISPQDAFVEMTEDGEISADSSGEIGNAVPMRVWHRRTLRWTVSPYANGDSLAAFLGSEALRPLFDRVYIGHTVEWDGNNHVGRLNEDAEDANEELCRALAPESENYTVMEVFSAEDWIYDGFDLSDLAEKGIDGYAEFVCDPDANQGQAVVGSIRDAVLSIAANRVQRHIDQEVSSNPLVLRVAELLASDDVAAYGPLLEAYRAEFDIDAS